MSCKWLITKIKVPSNYRHFVGQKHHQRSFTMLLLVPKHSSTRGIITTVQKHCHVTDSIRLFITQPSSCPMSKSSPTTHGGAGGRGCIAPTHSRPRQGMGVSGLSHASAALYPRGKGPPVPFGQEAGWAPEPVCTQRLQEKSSLPPQGIEHRSAGRPVRRQTLY
jgi:hypothetical protein